MEKKTKSEEMKLYNLDYLGITEIKKKGKGLTEMKDGYWLYWSAANTNKWDAEGVGLRITSEMIRYMGEVAKNYLCELLNGGLKRKEILKNWNTDVQKMFKKGDPKFCSNYSGIILTNALSKDFTRIIEKRLREKLEITIEESQHWFRKGRSA